MKRFRLIFHLVPLVILLFSCSSNQTEVDSLNRFFDHYEADYLGFRNAARFSAEDKGDTVAIQRLNALHREYQQALNGILESESYSEVMTMFNKFKIYIMPIVQQPEKLTGIEIPENNVKLFAKIQLAIFAKTGAHDISMDIGKNDIIFNEIQLLLTTDKPVYKVGEVIMGKVQLMALADVPKKDLKILLDGDTLEIINGYAEFTMVAPRSGNVQLPFKVESSIGFINQFGMDTTYSVLVR